MMLYPNGYININQNGEYTKHYYAGTMRIASKIGSGFGEDLCLEATHLNSLYGNYLEERKNDQYEVMREELGEVTIPAQIVNNINSRPLKTF